MGMRAPIHWLTRPLTHSLPHSQAITKPELSNENLIINELIREYCLWNGYRETASVLIPGWWSVGWLVAWLMGGLVSRWKVSLLVGWLVVCWMVGWWVDGRLVGWLVGWLIG